VGAGAPVGVAVVVGVGVSVGTSVGPSVLVGSAVDVVSAWSSGRVDLWGRGATASMLEAATGRKWNMKPITTSVAASLRSITYLP
jgi:hypothetical protein